MFNLSTVSRREIFMTDWPHSLLPGRTRLLNLAALRGWRLARVWMGVCVYTAAVKTKDGGAGGRGRGDHNGVGVKFICTQNWCMCRPRTTQLEPVSVNGDTHAQTQQRRKRTRAWHFSCSSFPLCSLGCHQIYCIPAAEYFLNYRFEAPSSRRKMTEMSVPCVFDSVLCFLLSAGVI